MEVSGNPGSTISSWLLHFPTGRGGPWAFSQKKKELVWKKEHGTKNSASGAQGPTLSTRLWDLVQVIPPISMSVLRRPLDCCQELSFPQLQILQACDSPQKINGTPGVFLAHRLTLSSFPHSVQIKATALYPSFVNSIFLWLSPGSLVVCSWTVFWEAFLLPHWASAMGLKDLQSHRMPLRERNERQEGKTKRNCNIKLTYPELHSGKTGQTELFLPLALKSSATKAETNKPKVHIFVGWDKRMKL